MNQTKDNLKKFSGLRCGQRKRPSAFTCNSIGHLRAAFIFNLLKITRYECKTSFRKSIICTKLVH